MLPGSVYAVGGGGGGGADFTIGSNAASTMSYTGNVLDFFNGPSGSSGQLLFTDGTGAFLTGYASLLSVGSSDSASRATVALNLTGIANGHDFSIDDTSVGNDYIWTALNRSGTIALSNGETSSVAVFQSDGGISDTPGTGTPSINTIGYDYSNGLASGSGVAITTATSKNIFSQVLPAGNYIVDFQANFHFNGITSVAGTAFQAGVNVTSSTLPSDGTEGYILNPSMSLFTGNISVPLASKLVRLPSGGTIYGVMVGVFSAGALTGFGKLTAIRLP